MALTGTAPAHPACASHAAPGTRPSPPALRTTLPWASLLPQPDVSRTWSTPRPLTQRSPKTTNRRSTNTRSTTRPTRTPPTPDNHLRVSNSLLVDSWPLVGNSRLVVLLPRAAPQRRPCHHRPTPMRLSRCLSRHSLPPSLPCRRAFWLSLSEWSFHRHPHLHLSRQSLPPYCRASLPRHRHPTRRSCFRHPLLTERRC